MKQLCLVDKGLNPIAGTADSLFISCASYERRTTLAIQKLSPRYRTEHSFICRAVEYKDKGKAPKYFEDIYKGLRRSSDTDPVEILFGIDGPINFIREMEKKVAGLEP